MRATNRTSADDEEKAMSASLDGVDAPPPLRRNTCYSRPGAFAMPAPSSNDDLEPQENDNDSNDHGGDDNHDLTTLSERQEQPRPSPPGREPERQDSTPPQSQPPPPPQQPHQLPSDHPQELPTAAFTLMAEPVDVALEATRERLVEEQTARVEQLERERDAERREREAERRQREMERERERLEHLREQMELDKAYLRERERVLTLELELHQMRTGTTVSTTPQLTPQNTQQTTDSTTPAVPTVDLVEGGGGGFGRVTVEETAPVRRVESGTESSTRLQQISELQDELLYMEQGEGCPDREDVAYEPGCGERRRGSACPFLRTRRSKLLVGALLVCVMAAVVVGVVLGISSSSSRDEPQSVPLTSQPPTASPQRFPSGEDPTDAVHPTFSPTSQSATSPPSGNLGPPGAPAVPSPTQSPVQPLPPEEITWMQVGSNLKGDAAKDQFGSAVALSADGTILAAAAPFSDGSGDDSGRLKVFQYDSTKGDWNQMGADLDGVAAFDQFGYAIALSADGTIVAAGSRWSNAGKGHVRIFQYDTASDQWNQLGADLVGEDTGNQFGYSVALSADGSRLAVGAIWNAGSGPAAGHARVFEYKAADNQWTQLGSDLDAEAAGDFSGWSVDLSSQGTILAVGATQNDGSGSGSGHVRVYQYDTPLDQWNQLGADLDGEAGGDWFGHSISLSADGTILASGATTNDGNDDNSGHVRVLQYDSELARWNQLGADLDGEHASDEFGYSVALSTDGMTLVAGAPYSDRNGTNSGRVRIFRYNGTSQLWDELRSDLDGEYPGDKFGWSVAISANDGMVVAAGAPFNDGKNGSDSLGHTRVFQRNG